MMTQINMKTCTKRTCSQTTAKSVTKTKQNSGHGSQTLVVLAEPFDTLFSTEKLSCVCIGRYLLLFHVQTFIQRVSKRLSSIHLSDTYQQCFVYTWVLSFFFINQERSESLVRTKLMQSRVTRYARCQVGSDAEGEKPENQ